MKRNQEYFLPVTSGRTEMAVSKNTMLEAFLNSVKEKAKAAGYSQYTVGMEILAKETYNLNKSVDDAIKLIREHISIDDCKCFAPNAFAPNCRSSLDNPKEPDSPVDIDPGAALFEAYVTAKQNLTEKLKTVLQILVACDALEVEQGDKNYIADYIGKNTKDIASYQWRYCAGHEKIYCQHTYRPQGATSFTSTMIKVPVKYLGMSDEEIWADNENNAIKALEEKKASYERKRSEILKPIDEKISGVDKQIKMLKAHQIVGKNGERE